MQKLIKGTVASYVVGGLFLACMDSSGREKVGTSTSF